MYSTFDELQKEVLDWASTEFPGQPSVNAERGITEELGELAYMAEEGDLADVEDAIGDTIIYICDFTGIRGLPLSECISAVEEDDVWSSMNFSSELLYAVGRLKHSELKLDQGIRLDEPEVGDEATKKAIGLILVYLSDIAVTFGTNVDNCIHRAWGEVSDREWDSTYKENGE